MKTSLLLALLIVTTTPLWADEKTEAKFKKHMLIAAHFDTTRVQPAIKENIKIEARLAGLKRMIETLPAKSPKLAPLQEEIIKLEKALAANKLFPEWLAAWKTHAEGLHNADFKMYSQGAMQLRNIHLKYKELTEKPFPNPETEVLLAEMKLEEQTKRKAAQAEKTKAQK